MERFPPKTLDFLEIGDCVILNHPGFQIQYHSTVSSIGTTRITMSKLNAQVTDIQGENICLVQNSGEFIQHYTINVFDLLKAALEGGNQYLIKKSSSLISDIAAGYLTEADGERLSTVFEKFEKIQQLANRIQRRKDNIKFVMDSLVGNKYSNGVPEVPIELSFNQKSLIIAFLAQNSTKNIKFMATDLGNDYVKQFFISPDEKSKNPIPIETKAYTTLITYFSDVCAYIDTNNNFNENNMDSKPVETKSPYTVERLKVSRKETLDSLSQSLYEAVLNDNYFDAYLHLASFSNLLETSGDTREELIDEMTETLRDLYNVMKEQPSQDFYYQEMLERLEREFSFAETIDRENQGEVLENPFDISFFDSQNKYKATLEQTLEVITKLRIASKKVLQDPNNSDRSIINHIESGDEKAAYKALLDFYNTDDDQVLIDAGLSRVADFPVISYLTDLYIKDHTNKTDYVKRFFDYVAFEVEKKNAAQTVIVPGLIRSIEEEPITKKGQDKVSITFANRYPNQPAENVEIAIDSGEKANFDYVFTELEKRILRIINVDLADRPQDTKIREGWDYEHIIAPLNELMMIFNSRIADMLPGKTSTQKEGEFIAEDWDRTRDYVGLKNKQSFTDFIFSEVSEGNVFKMLDLLVMVAKILEKLRILHLVRLGYQGVGKGAFSKTNAKVLKLLTEAGDEILDSKTENAQVLLLIDFIKATFGANVGETGTGTDRVAVPLNGEGNFDYARKIARETLSELVRGGGMVNDYFMTVMVIYEMIKILLLGFDGADVDTFPRTPGQLEIMEKVIIPYLKERGIEYKTGYEIYEMADTETADLIIKNKDSAAIAATALSKELSVLSKESEYATRFPESPLIASITVGKTTTAELDKNDLKGLESFYGDRAAEIRNYLLDEEFINKLFPFDTKKRETVIRIYKAHVMGMTKIIEKRVPGRLLAERRGDDNAIYSLLNRIRSTESTYPIFVTGVAKSIIGVDGTPAEAWEMWFRAKLKAENPELLTEIDNEDSDNAELKELWRKLVVFGKTYHELTINPVKKPVAAEA